MTTSSKDYPCVVYVHVCAAHT